MKKPLAVVVALVALLAFSGCSADGADSANNSRVAAGSTAEEPTAPATEEEAAASLPRYDDEVADADNVYLAAVHDGSIVGLDALTDEELVQAGLAGCGQLAAGQSVDTLEPITGASPGELSPGANDRNMTAIASQTLCPSFDVTVQR